MVCRGHTDKSLQDITLQRWLELLYLQSNGIIGFEAEQANGYKLWSSVKSLQRTVMSIASSKRPKPIPEFAKFAPEINALKPETDDDFSDHPLGNLVN